MSAQPSELTQGLRPGEAKIFCPGLGVWVYGAWENAFGD